MKQENVDNYSAYFIFYIHFYPFRMVFILELKPRPPMMT